MKSTSHGAISWHLQSGNSVFYRVIRSYQRISWNHVELTEIVVLVMGEALQYGFS